MLDEFSRQVDSIDWPTGSPEKINYKALDIHLAKYQVCFAIPLNDCSHILTGEKGIVY